MSPTFRALRIRNYRLYMTGGIIGNVGTWMQRVAQDWLVLQLTAGSGIALGITTGLQFLPMLLFGMYGGALADRYPKRRVLVLANIFMSVVALILGGLVLTDVVVVWHVYLLAFLLGMGTAIENPARQAFVVEMVGRKDLPNAVGLNSASFNAARIVGPAAAGFLIVAFGDDTGPVFLLNAVSYLAVIAGLRAMKASELCPSPRVARAKGQVREGIRYVLGRPDLLLVLLIIFFVGTFGLNFQMTTALVATEVFGKGSGEYGLLGSIMAVGSLTGALLAASRGRPRLRLVVGSAIVFGAFEVAAGLMPSYWLFAASLVFVGVSALTLITSANSLMQLSVDPELRGRVMALYMVVFFGGTPLGAPLIGAMGDAFGARWAVIGGGLVSIVGTVAAAAFTARRQHLRIRAHLLPHPHVHVSEEEVEPEVQAAVRVSSARV